MPSVRGGIARVPRPVSAERRLLDRIPAAPDLSGLATKGQVQAVAAQIPSIAGLAKTSEVAAVAAAIPSTANLATFNDVLDLAGATQTALNLKAGKSDLVGLAHTTDIPLPASANPSPEAATPAPGSGDRWARWDHKHQRLSVVLSGVLGTDGTKAIVFGRTFSGKPGLTLMSEGAGGQVTFDIVSWTRETPGGATDALKGGYTGCTIKGYRTRPLPQQTSLSVLAILGAVITGVNSLITSLSNFDPSAGPVSGVGFNGFAVAP